jgi:two-component system, LytTR family, sensor histidine kinase AlgZ
MITFNLFTALITLALLAPIVGSITLFSILAFEREIDVLKHENMQVHLEKELRHSEYMQLNQQIHPHFLFNTMNLILGLARLKKNEQLIEVLEHFSLFLKFKYRVKEQLISFSDELDYTKHYLAIQQIRMGQRLSITYEIDSFSDESVLTPPYMLQTLTENAFKHSLEKKSGMIELQIRYRTNATTAFLEVIDNGIGVIEDDFDIDQTKGHGLKNIKTRLYLLFGTQASIHLKQIPPGGVKVTVQWSILHKI